MTEHDDVTFEAFMDADQTVMHLKPGHVLTEADREAITLVIEWMRVSDERATDAYSRGFQDGRLDAGGKEVADLLKSRDAARADATVARAMQRFYRGLVAPTPPAGDGWEPIETAPKDSSAFIGWNGSVRQWTRWLEGEWWSPESHFEWTPTHWRPLPTPPAKGEKL